jgi:hypothetical protein
VQTSLGTHGEATATTDILFYRPRATSPSWRARNAMYETRGTHLSYSHYPTLSLLSSGRAPLYIYNLKAWSHILTVHLAEEERTDQFNPMSMHVVLFFLKKMEREVVTKV